VLPKPAGNMVYCGRFPEDDVGLRSRAGEAIGNDDDLIAVRRASEPVALKA